MHQPRVRCPRCSWEPDGKPHWTCTCGNPWDILRAHGRCPVCKARVEEVMCPDCVTASPILHWYEDASAALDELLADEDVPDWLRYGDVR